MGLVVSISKTTRKMSITLPVVTCLKLRTHLWKEIYKVAYLLARLTSVLTLIAAVVLIVASYAENNNELLKASVAMSIISTTTGMLTINSDVVDLGKEVDELYNEELED